MFTGDTDADQTAAEQAIRDYEEDIAAEYTSPEDIVDALDEYIATNTDQNYVTKYAHQTFDDPLYELKYSPYTSVTQVDVTSIDDIRELPCMENIHTYLQEEKPVRWILYSLVRIIFSIEPDDPEKDEFTVEDIVDWFDPDSSPGTGFPWFDEETSRYQITYEKNRRVESDGSKPNPVSCNNDNKRFDKFCIGIDNCDYSIYRSLPFKDEVYDRLESE